MKIKDCFLVVVGLAAVAVAYGVYIAAKLPDIVPVHWNALGQVDRYGSKWEGLGIMPGVLLFLAVLTPALPKLSPASFSIEPFEDTYCKVMTMVAAMMLAIHVVIVQGASGAHIDITRVMFAIIFFFFALLGNVMGRIKRNFYMGVRTPWTIADERVWTSTHRFTGKLWFLGGLLGALLAILGLPVVAGVPLLLILAIAPIAFSYVDYQRRQGGVS